MTPNLEFCDIERCFKRNVPVLNGVTFAVQAGEVAALLGRNGAGKTTLIRIAMGMLFPHGGSVRVFGASPTEDPVATKRRIGYVAEDQVLPPGSSIAELIALHRYLFPRWDGGLESQLLDRFALQPASRIKHLSKGLGAREQLGRSHQHFSDQRPPAACLRPTAACPAVSSTGSRAARRPALMDCVPTLPRRRDCPDARCRRPLLMR